MMSKQAIREQIVKTNDAIEAATGVKPRLFAPPSGSYRDDVVYIAHELGMYTIYGRSIQLIGKTVPVCYSGTSNV